MNLYQREIARREIVQMEKAVAGLTLICIQKDERAYKKLLAKLRDAVINAWNDQTKIALNQCIKLLVDKGEEKFTEADARAIDKILSEKLGGDLQQVVDEDVRKLTAETLKLGKKEILAPLDLKLSFNVSDKEASKILAEQNLFWVGNHYGENVKKKMDAITEGYFNSDKTIQQVAADFEKDFGKLTNQGEQYFYDLAEHQTNTVRELGKVNAMEEAGIQYYEIRAIMDDRTSAICQRLNGTTFPVARAVEYRDNIIALTDPDAIKQASPWLTDEEVAALPLSDEDLPPGLSLPPYHFRCRTVIVSVFKD